MRVSSAVGRALRAARERRGMTQRDLGLKIGRAHTSISYWEAGKRALTVDHLVMLADALGEDPAALLDTATHGSTDVTG